MCCFAQIADCHVVRLLAMTESDFLGKFVVGCYGFCLEMYTVWAAAGVGYVFAASDCIHMIFKMSRGKLSLNVND